MTDHTALIERLSETAARAVDEALRARADQMEELARSFDDRTAKPEGYHPNSVEWFRKAAPTLRADAKDIRALGRAILLKALQSKEGA